MNTPTVILIGNQDSQQENLTLLGKNVSKLLNKHFMNVNNLFQEIHTSSSEVGEYIKVEGTGAYRTEQLELLKTVILNNKKDTIISISNAADDNEILKQLIQIFKLNSVIVIHLIGISIGKEAAIQARASLLETTVYEFYLNSCPFNHKKGDDTVCRWLVKIEYQLSKFIQNCYLPNSSLLETTRIKSSTASPTLLFHSILYELPSADATKINLVPSSFPRKVYDWHNSYEVNEPNMLELHFMITNSLLELSQAGKTIQEILRTIGRQYFLLKCLVSKLPVILTFTKADEIISNVDLLIKFVNTLAMSAIKYKVDVFCIDEALKVYINEKSAKELEKSKIVTATLYKGPTLKIVLRRSLESTIIGNVEQGISSVVQLIRINQSAVNPLLRGKYLASSLNQLKDLNLALTMSGKFVPKTFYLSGSPIAYSKTPLMHNIGFTLTNLPYNYRLNDVKTFDAEFIKLVKNRANFGGGSVTMPIKEKIFQVLDGVTEAGKAIGACNTLFIDEDGKLFGDNTDYIGIMNVMLPTLEKLQAEHNNVSSILPLELRGLVIGGGGAARAAIYTLISIPAVKYITIVNESVPVISKIVDEFKANNQLCQNRSTEVIFQVETLEALNTDDLHAPEIIVAAIPIEAQHESCKFSKSLFKNLKIVVEMVYGQKTPLMEAVEQAAVENKTDIVVCDGGQVVIEQGLRQFEIWTGLKAPFEFMRSTVSKAFEDEYRRKWKK